MLKKINRVLRFFGLNLVRAKRRKGQRIKEAIAGVRPPYTVEELMNAPLKCAVNQPGAALLSDYTGDDEWHYVGDSCPGGHLDCAADAQKVGVEDHKMTRVEQPNSDNKISGPTS